MDFAGELRALMAERGISGRALARQVPCDPALICRYRRSAKTPTTADCWRRPSNWPPRSATAR